MPATILITGANRGIGLGFAQAYLQRGDRVIATCRKPKLATELQSLGEKYPTRLHIEQLDVTQPEDFARLKLKYSAYPIDVLINNAGIFPEEHDRKGVAHTNYQRLMAAFATNAAGPLLAIQTFEPNLLQSSVPKIINMASQLGSLEHANGFAYSYRMSKVALNMLTRSFAAENDRIITVSLRPGWVQTPMGGGQAQISVADSVEKMITIIDNLTREDSGTFLDNEKHHCRW